MTGRWIARGALGALVLTMTMWTAAPPALAGGGGGCFHHVTAGVGTGTEVDIVDFCFGPTVLYVDPGATVTWANQDKINHTVTGIGGAWGTFDQVEPGQQVAYTFKSSGTFVYVCALHFGMAGAVVVGDGTGAAGLDPASVKAAGFAAPPAADAASTVTGGVGPGTIVALIVVGLGVLVGLWAIGNGRRRRSVVSG
jgi:plastocyanin